MYWNSIYKPLFNPPAVTNNRPLSTSKFSVSFNCLVPEYYISIPIADNIAQ
jgi:hypothetical protein